MNRSLSISRIDARTLILGFIIAIVPAFGLYLELGLATNSPLIWIFFVALAGFTYLLYGEESTRNMIGATLFYLAIETFLFPVFIFAFTAVFSAQQESAAAAAGSAIGGGLMLIVSAILAFFIGTVLYLLSGKVKTETND